jgi:hypothetical protein
LKKSIKSSNFFCKLLLLIIAGKLLAILAMKTFVSCHLFLFCLLLPVFGNDQLILVTGNIINEKTGNALENVSILESNSGIGTITNINGYFSLMLNKGNVEIIVSHEGFKVFSKKLILKADTALTVSLVPLLNTKSKAKESDHQKTAEKIEKGKN